jgi:signal transduction histidine kinase
MMEGDEDVMLRSVALQNAASIFRARQRAEQDLIRTKEALEAKTEALARSLATVEASLRERDQARAEAEAANRAAQAANEGMSRFLNMISHELRTPLGAIGGYATLLADGIYGALTDDQQKCIARILHNQTHILHLVNELLDLAKIQSGQFALVPTTLPVRAVIESAYAMIEPQLRAAGLRASVEAGDPALRIHADRQRVEQIVLNLLSNAVKFTAAGGYVRLAVAQTGGSVCLEVQDTGPGIPADKREAVFQPFVQIGGRGAHAQASLGTGLGLPISRELARAMGGDLTLVSVPGEGSTFTLRLPQGRDAE